MRKYTTITHNARPHVTATAFALMRGLDVGRAEMLKITAPVYGHDNYEMIGRACANTFDNPI